MTRNVLLTTGTPVGGWLGFALDLLRSAPAAVDLASPALGVWHDTWVGATDAGVPPSLPPAASAALQAVFDGPADALSGGIDARACWALDTLGSTLPQAQFLLFVESPVAALAGWLAAPHGGGDPQLPLKVWCDGAQRLLRHAQRHAARCWLVDLADARRHPTALARMCGAALGVPFDLSGRVLPAATHDPLALSLAEALVAQDRPAQRLWSELQAGCLWLAGDTALAEAVAPASGVGGAQAVQVYRQVRTDLDQLRARLQTAEHERDQVHKDNALLQLQLHRLQREIDAGRDRLAQATDAGARLLREREQAHSGQIEALRAELDAAHQRQAQLGAELAAVQGRVLELQSELQAALLRQAEVTVPALPASGPVLPSIGHSQHAGTGAPAAAIDLAAGRDTDHGAETETLLLQLQQVQEELDHYYGEYQRLVGEPGDRPALAQALAGLQVDRVQVGLVRETPPHRELTLSLQRIVVRDTLYPELVVRLVEHNGHPGLVVFGHARHGSPLRGWRESGREAGEPYLLLVPTDQATWPDFDRLGAGDWLLLLALADQIHAEVSLPSRGLSARWQVVAGRLRQQLLEMPARWRYDAVKASVYEGPQGGQAIDLSFAHVHFGGQNLEGLRLLWWQHAAPGGAAAGAIELVEPGRGGDRLVLASWPLTDAGALRPSLLLPLGPAFSAQDKRTAWAALSAADQRFVHGLLAALPGALMACGPMTWPAGRDTTSLRAQAVNLLDDARRAVQARRARRVARALRDALNP